MDKKLDFILNDCLNRAMCRHGRIKYPCSNTIAEFVENYLKTSELCDGVTVNGNEMLCNIPVVKHSGSEFIEIGTKIQMQKREWWQIYKSGWHKHHDFWGRKWWIRYNWNI